LDYKAQLDLQAQPELQEGQLVPPELQAPPAQPDLLERLAQHLLSQVQQVQLEQLELKEILDLQDPPGLLDQQVQQVQPDLRELLDLLDFKDRLEQLVQPGLHQL
jgi:hypothetical protein